jgi:ABC-type transport system substrate-binding protein
VREHLDSVTDYSGIIGLISCDAFGDCGSQKITVIGHGDSNDIATSNANVIYEYAPGGSSLGEGNLVVPAPKPQYGGTVVVGLEAEAVGMRPWEDTCANSCYTMVGQIFDPLLRQARSGDYLPYLAESIVPNDDFTVWTVTIRSGITFSNGKAVSAQTYEDMWPIQQGGSSAAGTIATAGLINVEATGDFTIDYTLSATNVAFPSFLSFATIGYVFDPEAAADSDPSTPIRSEPARSCWRAATSTTRRCWFVTRTTGCRSTAGNFRTWTASPSGRFPTRRPV